MNTTERRHSICNCYNSIINYILEERILLNIEALGINIRELRKQSDDLFLGIDGGGTKTEFVLVSSEGYVLKRLVKSGCNPNDIGYDQPFSLK